MLPDRVAPPARPFAPFRGAKGWVTSPWRGQDRATDWEVHKDMANRDRFGLERRDRGGLVPSDLLVSPFSMMRRMADEMNQVLSQGVGVARDAIPFGGGFPSVDVRETAGSYVVEAELPGVQASDIDVSIQGDTLTIKGQTHQKQESRDEDRGFYVSERRYGSFHRELPLPGPVDESKTSAHFENGVLEIRMPKTGQEQGRRIQVNAGQKQEGGQDLSAGGVSQPGVEASTDNQSYAGEGSGESAKEAAQAFKDEDKSNE